MTSITIIGSGAMGSAIAGLAERGGHTVEVLGRADAHRTPAGDVVVLALPYPAVDGVLAGRADEFAGKVVVDITNPLDFETFDSLTVPADSSAAADIAAQLPGARVVKAFNTNFAATLAGGTVGDVPTTVLIAGDDAEAKALVSGIVTDAGLKAIDAGTLRRARELEAIGFLQITLAAREAISWAGGFAVQA
ncbi:NADPH-dependent F420 reductase [Tessaracoccus sp. Z1128]